MSKCSHINQERGASGGNDLCLEEFIYGVFSLTLM